MPVGGFHTITLGCKLNQFDTAVIESELARRGLERETHASRASVVVVNTCTVTSRADADARKRIRGVRRDNPGCWLLVTGCYAELDADALRALGGVDLVFGNRDKPRLPQLLDELGIGAATTLGDRGCDAAPARPATLRFGDRSRAFLKVQEGCRLACSYCIIPTVRGPSRSVAPRRLEQALRSLLEAGYREIVLTGVNVGDYGRDLEPSMNLAGLLRRLLAMCGPNRLRLNSLEPLTVTEEIVELLAAEPRLAPHLQVPLQSGSPAVLRMMRRNYRLEQYRERLVRLRDKVPHIGLGADVIVGFPGETAEHFEETHAFIAGSVLNYLHVFSWSPRPGTPASDFTARVPSAEVRRRSRALRELADELSHRFRSGFVGRQLDGVTLAEREDGRVRALTGNFIDVSLAKGSAPRGEPILLHIEAATRDETRAVVAGRPQWAQAARIT
jgi:threonylcarbamoyladenosine tRNA methylthiotransferase MtaB